ncbi:ATP-dependent acyl-CoA ligase [Neorhizobium galegae]|uniref:ATP-dependent acyl-CoA ligase n=1 Tax=Neorhizobium galegae TaxID=399 RepID=A0A6A1TUY3_NEOGA|nr:AMP-binding protein [Neorhizobium galegae]KAB1088621.1 ATP-dependent acyl-CoA ligase [Neorhizobium galegae]
MHSPYLLFENQALKNPNAPMLIAPASAKLPYAPEGFRHSYGDVFARVGLLKQKFAAAGYGIGGRVALLLENRPEFFDYWLALNAIGVSIVPVNPDLRRDELLFQLDMAEASLMVVIRERLDDLRDVSPGKVTVIAAGDDIPPSPETREARPGGPEAECALLFTSGSTGKPKGCILSNIYFIGIAEWYTTQGGIAEMGEGAEVALTPLPMFHMNALGCTAVGMIMKGGAIVPLDRFHSSSWWASIADSGATIIHCLGVIPAILLQLPAVDAERAHKVKFALGPGVDARHKIEFETRYGIPIVEAWAMTETGGRAVTTTAADDYTPGLRCIGRPRAQGANPRDGFFSGYLKDEKATEEAWEGGWFHTGDVVYADENGLLYFFDRKKSIVRRSGENIAVLEVEAALAKYPAVKASAVTPVPDELRGEEVFAFIVESEAAGAGEPAEKAKRIIEAAGAHIAYHKLPGYVVFIDKLPVSSTQKLQRGEIKTMAAKAVEDGSAIDLRKLKASIRKAG